MAEEASKAGDTPFTAGETILLVTIMQHLNSDIDFDADAVAAKLGYKNGGIAKTRWRQIKAKKINGGAGKASTAASPTGVTKRTPKKNAKAAAAAADGEGDGEEAGEVETPVKTPAKRARKPTKKKQEEEAVSEGGGEDEGEGEADVESKVKAEESDVF